MQPAGFGLLSQRFRDWASSGVDGWTRIPNRHQCRWAVALGANHQFSTPVLTAPHKHLVRVNAVASRERRDRNTGLESLKNDPQLLSP
jgi:hypothetical protein